MVRLCWIGLFAGGCFSPSPPLHSPCPNNICPSGLVCSPASLTCEEVAVDAQGIDAPDATPAGCYGTGMITVCPDGPITGNSQVTISVPTSLTTTTAAMCLPYHLPNGAPDGAYCLVAAKTVTITIAGRWTVTGMRPLVVLATSTMTVDGTIDVASHRGLAAGGAGSDPSTCVAGTAPINDEGGPGGSFASAGGAGGGIDLGLPVPAAPATAITTLRGGCGGRIGAGGNAGAAGRGGGAIYLIADLLRITGTINASGASGTGAGTAAGGGGGGSGGMIVLDSPAITIGNGARVFANGGGGGEGGGGSNGGNDGVDSAAPTTVSAGGAGNAGSGGDGGDGALGTTPATNGKNDADSGGGGGGGLGVIRVFPSQMLGGSISPPPT